jgi:hypothetical protein
VSGVSCGYKSLRACVAWLNTCTSRRLRLAFISKGCNSRDKFLQDTWMLHILLLRRQGAWQGDQIGRIFAQWVNVYFGQLLKNYRSVPQIWATLHILWISLRLNFDKKLVGLHFVRFFSKNSSGHPGAWPDVFKHQNVSNLCLRDIGSEEKMHRKEQVFSSSTKTRWTTGFVRITKKLHQRIFSCY